MKVIKIEDGYLCVLKKGEEVIKTLTDFCVENKINSGFVSGIGAVEDINIGYFDEKKKEYIYSEIKESCEVLSMTGDISLKDKKPFLHLHIVLGKKDFNAIGGHLFKAFVSATLEVFILPSKKSFIRNLDDETGLYLIKEEN